MKRIIVYSKIMVLFLVFANHNACKKGDTVAAATTAIATCKISKVDYGGGEYDAFTYNSTGQVSQYDGYYKDDNGKIIHIFSTYTYDQNGLLSNTKYGDGTGQEKYSYTNGALNTIEVFDNKNVSVYKISVTTDANKRIIGMKDSDNNSAKITRDALGNFTKSEVTDVSNNLVLREEVSSYDGKKNWRSTLLGWPIDATSAYDSYIFYGGYFNEPSGGSDDDKLYFGLYAPNGTYTGKLTLVGSSTFTKQYNSKGLPTQAVIKDVVDASRNSTRIYTYTDCQ